VNKPATVSAVDADIRHGIKEYNNCAYPAALHHQGEFVGGSDIMMEMYENGELQQMLGAPNLGPPSASC
jgi:monothiol glutaredoxin